MSDNVMVVVRVILDNNIGKGIIFPLNSICAIFKKGKGSVQQCCGACCWIAECTESTLRIATEPMNNFPAFTSWFSMTS